MQNAHKIRQSCPSYRHWGKLAEAFGNNGMTKRNKANAAVLKIKIPIKSTEPAVGAWAWASGNNHAKGNIGNLTAKPIKKQNMMAYSQSPDLPLRDHDNQT